MAVAASGAARCTHCGVSIGDQQALPCSRCHLVTYCSDVCRSKNQSLHSSKCMLNDAIVVGVDQCHRLSGFPALTHAVSDARAFAALLSEPRLKFRSPIRAMKNPTRFDVRSSIAAKLATMSSFDRLFFYFAGHGTCSGKGSDESDDASDALVLGDGLLRLDELVHLLTAAHRRPCVTIIIDACFSGKLAQRVFRSRTPGGLEVLTSSQGFEVAADGRFTPSLVQYLQENMQQGEPVSLYMAWLHLHDTLSAAFDGAQLPDHFYDGISFEFDVEHPMIGDSRAARAVTPPRGTRSLPPSPLIAASDRVSVYHPPFQLPPRNTSFLAREADLAKLRTLTEKPERIVVRGMGGVGKTSLITELVHRLDLHFVFWLRAQSKLMLSEDFVLAARDVGLVPSEETGESPAQIRQQFLRWLEVQPEQTRWILVYDNVPNRRVFDESWFPQSRCLRSPSHNVVITSRDTKWAHAVPLQVMSEAEAAAMLAKESQIPDDSSFVDIARLLGGLPLAIKQAGATMRKLGSGGRYLARCRDRLPQMLARQLDAPLDYAQQTVASTFQLALEQCAPDPSAGDVSSAADIMDVCAWLSSDAILCRWPAFCAASAAAAAGAPPHTDVVQELWVRVLEFEDELDFEDALQVLAEAALICSDGDGATSEAASFSVHRLVQEVSRSTMSDARRRASLSRALTWASDAMARYHPDRADTWALARAVIPHADRVLEHSIPLLEDLGLDANQVYRLVHNTAEYYHRTAAEYSSALKLCRFNAAHTKTSFGTSDPRHGVALSQLSSALKSLGLNNEAEEMAAAALPQGTQHSQQVEAVRLVKLADVHVSQRKYKLAEKTYRAVLAMPDLPRHTLAVVLNDHGTVLEYMGELERAVECHEQSLALKRQDNLQTQPGYATTLMNLAKVLSTLRRFPEATSMFAEALALKQEIYGPDHDEVAHCLWLYADCLKRQDRRAEARQCLDETIRIWERVRPGHRYLHRAQRLLNSL